MKTVWTIDRIKDAARDHVAYGWAKSFRWHADGTPWSEEERMIYKNEYELLMSQKYPHRYKQNNSLPSSK